MYQYKAYTADKKIIEGTIDAANESTAEDYLRKAGYRHILTLEKTRPAFNFERAFPRLNRVNRTDTVEMLLQLATLVDSHMPVIQALGLLAEQSAKVALKDIINNIGKELSGGASFAQSLADYGSGSHAVQTAETYHHSSRPKP